ncbi:MAG: ABC transporter ATP-binding protein [Xanthobacteraceae bacterium]
MLLELDQLKVRFRTGRGDLHAIDGVSFGIKERESLGIVGESGCGKTTLARAILRILPSNGESSGRVLFRERDLLAMDMDGMREVRWRGIALVTQSAMNALNPVCRVGAQIVEAIRTHERCSRRAAWDRAAELFESVGLKADWVRRYPHEFSGGMRQRAIIAMALALNPPLIIADEPTTALDVIMQDQVFAEVDRIRRDRGTALILITHDISLVSENCDRIAIMYAGQVAEMAPTAAIFDGPMHPYTIGLQNAFADLGDRGRDLISIAGAPPDLTRPPAGCRFAPRCPFAREKCNEPPPLVEREGAHWVACHFADEAESFRRAGRDERTWEKAAAASALL